MSAPAGWHPQEDGRERFWDGTQWTDQFRPGQQGQVLAAPQPRAMQQVAPKSPGLALVASFFIPGLGSLMNGKVGMGILIFCLYVVAWMSMTVLIGLLLVPAVWIWGMVDGYLGAKNWNAAHGIVS